MEMRCVCMENVRCVQVVSGVVCNGKQVSFWCSAAKETEENETMSWRYRW